MMIHIGIDEITFLDHQWTCTELQTILGMNVLSITRDHNTRQVDIEIDGTPTHKQQLILDTLFPRPKYDEDMIDDIMDLLPEWSVVETVFENLKIDAQNITNLAEAKSVLVSLINKCKKMARLEYWLTKHRGD